MAKKVVVKSKETGVEMPDWFERLLEELNELTGRIERLRAFMKTEKFENELDDIQKNLLTTQLSAMVTYESILMLRIDDELANTESGEEDVENFDYDDCDEDCDNCPFAPIIDEIECNDDGGVFYLTLSKKEG